MLDIMADKDDPSPGQAAWQARPTWQRWLFYVSFVAWLTAVGYFGRIANNPDLAQRILVGVPLVAAIVFFAVIWWRARDVRRQRRERENRPPN